MSVRSFAAGAFSCAILAAAAAPASAEPMTLRIAYAVAPAHMTALIPAAPKEIYRHYGKSYTVKTVRIAGSGPALTALAAGEIEMGGLSVQALTLSVNRAKIDLTVVGQQMSTGIPGWADSTYWVRKGEIARLEDVKGKRVGINARGSTIDAAVQAMLLKVGYKPGTDYTPVEVSIPSQLAALESKRIDVAFLSQPFDILAEKKGQFQKLFSMSDALGPSETITWMGKTDWVKKNRAVVVDFLEDNIRLRRWIADPKNRPAVLELVAKVTRRPAAQYADWVFTSKDTYRDPNAAPNVERLQKNLDDLVALKIVPFGLDMKKYVDLSLSAEAAARLEPVTQ